MKRLLIIVLVLISISSFGQADTTRYISNAEYGDIFKRIKINRGLIINNLTTIHDTTSYKPAVINSDGVVSRGSWFASNPGTVTSVSGTSNRITSTGGATPVIDISASYVGQTSLTTLGTIATGTWQGTSVSTTYTDAKIKTVTGTSNRLAIGGTSTDPTFDISTSYVGQATITTLGTITTGTWNAGAVSANSGDVSLVTNDGTNVSGISMHTQTGSSVPTTTTAGKLWVDNSGVLKYLYNGVSTNVIGGGEVPLTFSTGLTRSTNTITSNLSTGISGGQSVIGGTGASENLTLSSTSNGTKGFILFGASSGYDGANIRLGVNIAAPTAKLHVVQTSIGVSNANANGLYLQNTTVASSGNQQLSPPVVWEGQGWKTNSTAASQAVAWMADILPIQSTVNPSSQWQLAASTNGGSYTNILAITDAGVGTFTGTWRATASASAGTQIVAGTTTTSQVYRTTNGGSNVTAQLQVANTAITAGALAVGIDLTNGITFQAGNGTRQIARAGISIGSLTNTAGSETGDMIFYTQAAGAAINEKARISSAGILSIGVAGTTLGQLTFNGNTSGTITVKSAAAAGTWSLTLPVDDGAANTFLQSDGNGVTSWVAGPTSVTGTGNQVLVNGTSGSAQTGAITLTLPQNIGTSSNVQFNDIQTASIAASSYVRTAGFQPAYVAKTGTYTVTSSDYTVDGTSGSWTATLPSAVGISGQVFIIKNSGSGTTITVACTGGQTIDGAATYSLAAQYKYVMVQSTGAVYDVIGNN